MNRIKLSKETLELLNYLVLVNNSIVFKPGHTQAVISNSGTTLAVIDLVENIPFEFGIYDLKRFLSTLGLFEEPEIDFSNIEDRYITIQSGNDSAKYFINDIEVIRYPPTTDLGCDNPIFTAKLSEEMLKKLARGQRVSRLEDLRFTDEKGKIVMTLLDTKNPESNTINSVLGDYAGDSFEFLLSVKNFDIIPANYNLSFIFGEREMVFFKSADGKIRYWVAMKKGSKYKGVK